MARLRLGMGQELIVRELIARLRLGMGQELMVRELMARLRLGMTRPLPEMARSPQGKRYQGIFQSSRH